MKKILAILLALLFITLLCVVVTNSDYYKRHYGYGLSDRIRIFCYVDGKILRSSDYSISFFDGSSLSQSKFAYTSEGDYGTYWYTLTWNGKKADFYLENANNWWRTDISLDILNDGQTVKQTNYIFNNEPPITEVYSVAWSDR